MTKTYNLTLTSDEMVTIRAALSAHVGQRLLEIDLATADGDLGIADWLSNQCERTKLVYAKVYYQHEEQCEAA